MGEVFEKTEAIRKYRSKLCVAESLVETGRLSASELSYLLNPIVEYLASRSDLRVLASSQLDVIALNHCRELLEKAISTNKAITASENRGR